MSKRIGMAVALIGALGLGTAAQAKTQFNLWHGLSGDLGAALDVVCKEFNEAQSDYEVVCASQGNYETAVQNTIAAFRTGTHPTILMANEAATMTMLMSGAIVPVPQLMADNGYEFDTTDINPAISAYYSTSKGELYSFPFNSSTAIAFWNKDAFATIGKTKAPETWQELDADTKALKAAGRACPFGWVPDSYFFLDQFSATNDLPIATKGNGYQGLDAELVFNKTQIVDEIRLLKTMYDNGQALLRTPEAGVTTVQSFANDDCAYIFASPVSLLTIQRTAKPGMKWATAKLPTWEGRSRTNSLVGGAALWAMANRPAAEQKAAAAFFDYVGQPERRNAWTRATGYLPVTEKAYNAMKEQGVFDVDPYQGVEVTHDSLTVTNPTENSRGVRLGNYIEIRSEFRKAMTDVILNNADPQVAIDGAAERGNALLRRFEKSYAGKTLP